MRDNTTRKRADEELRNSLRQKETLLKEVHHRVKNNLQVVTSLLNLQADRLTDPGAVVALREMRNRVHTIAAIHELLYRSGDLSRIDFSEYVRRLAHDLMVFHDVDPDQIDLTISAEEAYLDLSQAVPAGLLINELLTNTFKHAFSDGSSGRVRVTVACDDGIGRIEVADTGKGLPVEGGQVSGQTMGLQLVSLLAEQLQGEITVDSAEGTRFEVIFPCTPK
jgi:two-component sensor histidine kinase